MILSTPLAWIILLWEFILGSSDLLEIGWLNDGSEDLGVESDTGTWGEELMEGFIGLVFSVAEILDLGVGTGFAETDASEISSRAAGLRVTTGLLL